MAGFVNTIEARRRSDMAIKRLSGLVAAVAVSLGITLGTAGGGFVADAAARGTAKIKKIKATRAQVRKACEKAYSGGGYGYNAKKGGYGCANGNTGAWIDCKANGQCTGGTGKQ
jgi:uncharacterized membrane protein